jgi:hypothetical protein
MKDRVTLSKALMMTREMWTTMATWTGMEDMVNFVRAVHLVRDINHTFHASRQSATASTSGWKSTFLWAKIYKGIPKYLQRELPRAVSRLSKMVWQPMLDKVTDILQLGTEDWCIGVADWHSSNPHC